MQLHRRYLQVRIHQRRLLHQLHEWRQGLPGHDSGLLQLLVLLLRIGLLLLHLLQQHAGLLRHLCIIVEVQIKCPGDSHGLAVESAGAFFVSRLYKN
jgi:hypothetical protein